jgi:DNA-binding transcriptional LysR family regulator
MFARQLEYLVALDRERHFGRAAATCHVSQPALSEAVRSLERELGVPLVRRSRRFEGFTPEGERVLAWAQRAVADLRGLEQEASRLRGGLDGTLRIGAIPTAVPASSMITTRFREHHPRMHVTLRSATSREIATGLETGELDAGLTYVDNEPLHDVDARPLWRERYLLLTPADGPFGSRTTVGWAEAATLPLCLLTPDMQHRRIIDGAFAAAGAVAAPVVETNSVSAVIAHARIGVSGVTAQTWIARLTVPAGLKAIPLVDPVLTKTIGIITSARTQRSPVVEELLVLFAPLELDEAVAGP